MQNKIKTQEISFDEYIKKLYIGRIDRKSWALGFLAFFVFLFTVPQLLIRFIPDNALNNAFPIVFGFILLLSQIFLFSLHVRRLHDTNKSGWWSLLQFVPIVGLFLFVLLLRKGDNASNTYGEAPDNSTKLLFSLLNKTEIAGMRIRLSGYFISFAGALTVAYISLWLVGSIWLSALAGCITTTFLGRQEIKDRGASYFMIITAGYIVLFFVFMLLLTAINHGCPSPLSCKSIRFFENLLRY